MRQLNVKLKRILKFKNYGMIEKYISCHFLHDIVLVWDYVWDSKVFIYVNHDKTLRMYLPHIQ